MKFIAVPNLDQTICVKHLNRMLDPRTIVRLELTQQVLIPGCDISCLEYCK